MGKQKSIFMCESCGYETYKWMGKCPRCNGWDTIKEIKEEPEESRDRARPVLIEDDEVTEERITLGIEEMDRVLGGGLTKGSSILLGGDPGIGKTTLSFAVAARLSDLGSDVLYVSGEESLRQLAGRKKRLGLKSAFSLLVTNQLGDILEAVREKGYGLVIIDSIQSVYNTRLGFSAGEREPDQGCQLKADQGAETAGNYSYIHRACHEGRSHCGTKDTGAYG